MQRWGESCNIYHRMKAAEKREIRYKGSFSTTILPYDTTLMAVSQRASLRAARFQSLDKEKMVKQMRGCR